MNKGDLVVVKQGYISSGETGFIIEMSKGYANVYWAASGKTYWISIEALEKV
jgi:ribosomal protein L9|tara:strand:+ start:687 stop:842 length:156 start_codon:yes stop_codon:yes gene_type:complete